MGHLEESLRALNARFEEDWQRTSDGELGLETRLGLKHEAATDPKSCLQRIRTFPLSGTEPAGRALGTLDLTVSRPC